MVQYMLIIVLAIIIVIYGFIFQNWYIKNSDSSLTGVAQWIECGPVN